MLAAQPREHLPRRLSASGLDVHQSPLNSFQGFGAI